MHTGMCHQPRDWFKANAVQCATWRQAAFSAKHGGRGLGAPFPTSAEVKRRPPYKCCWERGSRRLYLSQEWCTSPDGNNGEDCWAGSDSEPCTCSQGEARETGETIEYEGDLYYGYTCCTSGNNEGEHCGDYEGGIVVLIVFLLFVCCFIGCGVGIGVCICKVRGGDDDVWW